MRGFHAGRVPPRFLKASNSRTRFCVVFGGGVARAVAGGLEGGKDKLGLDQAGRTVDDTDAVLTFSLASSNFACKSVRRAVACPSISSSSLLVSMPMRYCPVAMVKRRGLGMLRAGKKVVGWGEDGGVGGLEGEELAGLSFSVIGVRLRSSRSACKI